jgi:hypothetical protein
MPVRKICTKLFRKLIRAVKFGQAILHVDHIGITDVASRWNLNQLPLVKLRLHQFRPFVPRSYSQGSGIGMATTALRLRKLGAR